MRPMTEATKTNSCWPWAHQWEKWRDFETRAIDSPTLGGTVGVAIKQVRRCEVCNEVRLRTEKTTL